MDSIPAIYAFTGIDYLPSFRGKDKIRPTKLMALHKKIIDVSKYFEETETIALNIRGIAELVCHVYGYKKAKTIQDVLALHFGKKN